MKIGIILHPYGEGKPAGLGRAVYEMARSMLALDRKNEYVIYLRTRPKVPPVFPGDNWKIKILDAKFLWLDIGLWREKLDVCIFNTPVMPLFVQQKRSIVVVYDFAYRYLLVSGLKEKAVSKITAWYHGVSLRRASHVVAISEATKRDVITFYALPPEKISVIYPGFFRVCQLQEKQMRLPEKFFLFVGVVKPRKNVGNIIKAFIRFYKRHQGYHLVVAGKGEGQYAHAVKRLAEESEASSHVHFFGFISDNELAYVYKHATALVFPSLIEGFGFPVLEAMDCGVPVITSKTFSLPEVGGEAALIVNPRDSDDISHAMERLVKESRLHEKCITAGKEHSARFSWEKTAQEMLRVAESLCDGIR